MDFESLRRAAGQSQHAAGKENARRRAVSPIAPQEQQHEGRLAHHRD
jgi:hypothetical protein